MAATRAVADPCGVVRIAPGLTAAVLALLCAAPAAPAANCRAAKKCDPKPAIRKPAKHATGWHNGTYDGGPGDPIIAPVAVRAHR